MAKHVPQDRIEINGWEVRAVKWDLHNQPGHLRTITIELIPDDNVTINGRTIEDIFEDHQRP